MWSALKDGKALNKSGARVMGAASRPDLEEPAAQDIVSAHAYTILDAVDTGEARLVKALIHIWHAKL